MVKFKESYHAPGTNINGKLLRVEPGARRPRTRVATFSPSRGRERVLPGGFLSLGAERSSQWERKPESNLSRFWRMEGFGLGWQQGDERRWKLFRQTKTLSLPLSGSLVERGQRSRGNSCGQLGIAVKRPRHQVESLCLQVGFQRRKQGSTDGLSSILIRRMWRG